MPSTGPAPSTPHRSSRSRTGPRGTDTSGRPASIGWTTTSPDSTRHEGRTTTMTDDNASRDAVVIERSFDAPVELIWQMWTDPEHVAAWYGPDGASVPV